IVGTPVIAAETDAAGQAGGLYEPAQFVLVPPLPDFLFADERGFVSRFGFAFLPGQHLLGAEELDGLSVYGVVEGDGPKHALAFLLAPGTQLCRESLEGCANVSKLDVKYHVAIDNLSTMDGEACFERLGIKECVGRLRLPESGQHLGVDSMCI